MVVMLVVFVGVARMEQRLNLFGYKLAEFLGEPTGAAWVVLYVTPTTSCNALTHLSSSSQWSGWQTLVLL